MTYSFAHVIFVQFPGDRCETNIDDCANQCGANGRCDDGIDGFTCVCNSGYTGSNCEVRTIMF